MQGGSVRIEGKPWDRPRVGPSELTIQVLCRATPFCVECQETEPGATRRVLNGLHKPSTQTGAATPTMYEQLRNLRPMRLVRCPGRVELDRANDPVGIAGDKDNRSGVGGRSGPSPPVFSALERERREKTHGSSRIDRIHQKQGETSEIGVTHRQHQLFDAGAVHLRKDAVVSRNALNSEPCFQTGHLREFASSRPSAYSRPISTTSPLRSQSGDHSSEGW